MKTKLGIPIILSYMMASLMLSRVYGDNPDLSLWLKNLSEPFGANQPVLDDCASEIVISGNIIHVMWMADSALTKSFLFYRRSVDNGNTWQDKLKLVEVAYDHNFCDKRSKRMVVNDKTVHIAYSKYYGNAAMDILYIRSTDGGATFEPIRTIYSGQYTNLIYLAGSGDNLSVLFYDSWLEGDITVLTSSDNGDAFSTGMITHTVQADQWDVCDLARDENYIYALFGQAYYFYGIQFGDLYLGVSSDGGSVFHSTKISIPSGNGNHKTFFAQDNNYFHKIAVNGSHVYVIWSGLDGDDMHNVFVRHSPDHGLTWDEANHISASQLEQGETPQAGQESIMAQGDYVYAMFLSTSGNIYISTSNNSGQTFSNLKKLNASVQTPHIGSGWWPQSVIDPNDPTGKTAHIIWSYPVYVCTKDGGETFTKAVPVGTQFSWKGQTGRPHLAIGSDGSIHYVTEGHYYWDDYYRDVDIFYRRLDQAPEPSGNAALKLAFDRSVERYDNMAVPSSADLQLTDQLSLEAWINPEPESERSTRIITKEDMISWYEAPSAYQIGTYDYAGGRYVNAGIQTTDGEFMNWSGAVPAEGVWTHIAMTYNKDGGNNNLIVYINGQISTTMTATGSLIPGEGILFIGPVNDSYGYNGLIDEVRVWDRALTQDEILAGMYMELQGNETGLAAYYNFNNTTKDITGHGNDGILMYREEFVESVITAPDGDQDGVSDLEEWGPDGADFDYDGNSDGVADWQQFHVASFHVFSKTYYVTLSAPPNVNLVNVTPTAGPGNEPVGYSFPYGFFEFTLQLSSRPDSIPIILYDHDGPPVDTYFNFGFLPEDRSPQWYEFNYDGSTGATSFAVEGVFLAYFDGLRGDDDLLPNGVITTMGGPAKESEGVGELGYENTRLWNFPNPCNGCTDIHFMASGPGMASLTLYNGHGEKIDELFNDRITPGEHVFHYQTGHLENGIYYLRFTAGSYQETRKLVVIH